MASTFASSSVSRHLLRGSLGISALMLSIASLQTGTILGITGGALLAVSSLVFLRGCPMCWVLGLIETVSMQMHQRQVHHFGRLR